MLNLEVVKEEQDMKRFVTYEKQMGFTECMSEEEYQEFKNSDRFKESHEWEEWVWQYAVDKRTAIAQHDAKMDEYAENPNKDTY